MPGHTKKPIKRQRKPVKPKRRPLRKPHTTAYVTSVRG